MKALVAKRLLAMLPTLLGITLLTFLAVHAAPGDPAARASDSEASVAGAHDEARTLFRAEHLLDEPLWKQYLHFLGPFDLSRRGARAFGGSGEHAWHGLLAGDLGTEFQRPGVAVLPEIGARLAVTAPLALGAVLLMYLLGVPIGTWSALRRDRFADRASRAVLLALHSVPTFWLALLGMAAFGAGGLAVLPVIGLHGQDAEDLGAGAWLMDLGKHVVLPLATLALPGLAYVARQTRAALLEVLEQDFVRAARARGLAEHDVIVKHALRNAMLPLVTMLATLLPALLGGSVIVETLFGIPGLGKYAYDGMLARDLGVILGVTTVTAVITLVAILLADLAYAVLDPRVRTG